MPLIFNQILTKNLLTQGSINGTFQITSTAVFVGLEALSGILRHNAPHGAFFYGQVDMGSLTARLLRKFRGLPTRNRLTTSLEALGHALKLELKMTKALLARDAILSLKKINETPRILDLDLAEALGFIRPRDIRQLIERNIEELKTHGLIAVLHRAYRGHRVTEYYLSESQALLVCLLSKTAKAGVVRKQVIDIYQAYRVGELTPVKPATATPHFITHHINFLPVTQLVKNGFINGSQLCAVFGVSSNDLLKSPQGKALYYSVAAEHPQAGCLVVNHKPDIHRIQGDWYFPQLAVKCADFLQAGLGKTVEQWVRDHAKAHAPRPSLMIGA